MGAVKVETNIENKVLRRQEMLFQLCYASKTTAPDHRILIDLRDILSEARDFNAKHQINGVLYFADEYFFQCIEGDDVTILQLLEKLKKDARHQDMKILCHKNIEQHHFSQWSMKYVQRNSLVQQFFKDKGETGFKPMDLTENDLSGLLELLYEIDQTELSQ